MTPPATNWPPEIGIDWHHADNWLVVMQGDWIENLRPLPDGRFKPGHHYNQKTEFKKGQHWRERKPFWNRDWLFEEYVTKQRSASEIAKQFGIGDTAIHFWLKKHSIPTRSISEARKLKHWGSEGPNNPMYGKLGQFNPNWKGGLTPIRQKLYSKSEWKSARRKVRNRDKVCRLCDSSNDLEIHHIDPFSSAPLLAFDIGNLILLCKRCHNKITGKEKRWKKKLFNLLAIERR